MAIRYRTFAGSESPAREGQVENIAELEALATIGSLAPTDEVALDGVKFQRAGRLRELRGTFREKEANPSGSVANLFVWIGLGILGLVALGVVVRVAALAVKLAVLAAIGAGVFWLVRKLLK